jgi:hypothetical protein
MPNRSSGQNIQNHKLRGEWAELRFLQTAIERGFRVTKPWGETAPLRHRHRPPRPLPSRSSQVHHLQAQQLLRLHHLLQPRRLQPRPTRLLRRPGNPRRHLVHPPHPRHQQPTRHSPVPAPHQIQVQPLPGSLAFVNARTASLWDGTLLSVAFDFDIDLVRNVTRGCPIPCSVPVGKGRDSQAEPNTSREAATERSPRRKPWVEEHEI